MVVEHPTSQRWAKLIKRFLVGQSLLIDPIHDLRWNLTRDGYILDKTRLGTLATYSREDNFFFLLEVYVGIQPISSMEEGFVGDEPFFKAYRFVQDEGEPESEINQAQYLPEDIYSKLIQVFDSYWNAQRALMKSIDSILITQSKMDMLQSDNQWTPLQLRRIPVSRRPSMVLVHSRIHNLMADLMDYFRDTPNTFRRYNQVLTVRNPQQDIQEGGDEESNENVNGNFVDNFDAESNSLN